MAKAPDIQAVAEEIVQATGARVTQPRVLVLAALLQANRALTHSEIEARLDKVRGINRVTVYRVLEWLTEHKIAHKIAGDDRVWRFNVQTEGHTGHHPHFVCNGCGRVTCLSDVPEPAAPKVPIGFSAEELELTVKGLCDACGEHSRRKRGGRVELARSKA